MRYLASSMPSVVVREELQALALLGRDQLGVVEHAVAIAAGAGGAPCAAGRAA